MERFDFKSARRRRVYDNPAHDDGSSLVGLHARVIVITPPRIFETKYSLSLDRTEFRISPPIFSA